MQTFFSGLMLRASLYLGATTPNIPHRHISIATFMLAKLPHAKQKNFSQLNFIPYKYTTYTAHYNLYKPGLINLYNCNT